MTVRAVRRVAELEHQLSEVRRRLAVAERETDRTLLRATRLAQIVSALGQIDATGRIARIAGEVAELFSAEVGLLLLGDGRGELRVAGRWGLGEGEVTEAVPSLDCHLDDFDRVDGVLAGPVGSVPRLNIPVVADAQHLAWIRLRGPHRDVGFLLLGRMHDLAFTTSEVHELKAVGLRAALVVDNAELQQRTNEQLRQMQMLHHLSASLAGTVDMHEAGDVVIDCLLELAPQTTVGIYRRREAGWACFVQRGERNLPDRLEGSTPTVPDDLEALVLRDGERVVGAIVIESLPAEGRARELLPHVQHVVGLALGKTLLHEQTALQARHDALTGLPNRTLLREHIDQALQADGATALIFLDLDQFKVINDSLGHEVGDQLLVGVAKRLREAIRPQDIVARLGGDEFVVLCRGVGTQREAHEIAWRIAEAMSVPIDVAGTSLNVRTSQGVAIAGRGATAETLLRDADAAMYEAKARGRDRVEVFDDRLRARVTARFAVEQALREAVADGRLVAHYEPVRDLRRGRVVAVEALLSYRDTQGRLVQYPEFAAVAEETELAVVLGSWLLSQACLDMATWLCDLGEHAPERVLVDVSARQLVQTDYKEVVWQALGAASLDADRLGLELTDSVLMEGGAVTRNDLAVLREAGVQISVADFGTGSSPLSHLRQFPIDRIKLGRVFVDGLTENRHDAAIVEAVIGLAKVLEIESAAEGVEHPAQLEMLRRLGCGQVQGELIGGPQSARSVMAMTTVRVDAEGLLPT